MFDLGPAEGVLGAPGGYGPGDMAALGASLAVLLVISMVVIGLLVFRIQKGKTDWRKLSEANIFRSSVSSFYTARRNSNAKLLKATLRKKIAILNLKGLFYWPHMITL